MLTGLPVLAVKAAGKQAGTHSVPVNTPQTPAEGPALVFDSGWRWPQCIVAFSATGRSNQHRLAAVELDV